MRATGIVRMVDDLGRIVIPIEQRRTMGIEPQTPMEILTENDELIILRKYMPGCIFCKRVEDCTMFYEKKVCSSCIEIMARR